MKVNEAYQPWFQNNVDSIINFHIIQLARLKLVIKKQCFKYMHIEDYQILI